MSDYVSIIAACGAAFSGVAGLITSWMAFKAIKRNDAIHNEQLIRSEKARENERLLSLAVLTMERAYGAISAGKENWNVPPLSRVNWLASARLIEEFKMTKSRISDELLLQECSSHEAHWRHQFYLLLNDLDTQHPDYFRQGRKESIQLISAIVVSDFAMWPEDREDALNRYKNEDEAMQQIGVHLKWANLQIQLRKQ